MTLDLNRRHFITGTAAISAFNALPAYARKKAPKTGWAAIQSVLDDHVKRKYAPGAGAAIARGTEPATFMVAGTLAKDSTIAITPDTLWRAYSMTKPVTGIAAMLLIEDGKMKLDQNIADFLPAFANPRVQVEPNKGLESRPAKAPITVRGLLTHTAGFGYTISTKGPLLEEYNRLGLYAGQVSRKPLPGFSGTAPHAPSLAEFADRLATLPLIYDPGVRWNYSMSLDLLGRVIEVASGMSFEAFLEKRIFGPLGMKSTFFQVPSSEIPRFTANHASTPFGSIVVDEAKDSIYLDKPPYPMGGAGLVCSMRDYDRFLQMLAGLGKAGNTRIMATETARLAMSNMVHPNTIMDSFVKGQGFGAGGRVTIADDPQGSGIGTYGWAGAASTIAWVDPTRGIRASGWIQVMSGTGQPFPTAFGKAVYASAKPA